MDHKNKKMYKYSFEMEEYDWSDITDDQIKALLQKAILYMDFAYAPYSQFQVGAAVLTHDGQIFGGSNVENASYPLCMCAERNALYHAYMADPSSKPIAVAITAKTPNQILVKPVMPCGACRQVILEFETIHGHDIAIYLLTNNHKVFKVKSIKDLVPYSFDGSFL